MPGHNQTCPLRGLNICDGHQLEDDQHALTQCLCEVLSDATRWESHHLARATLDRHIEAVTPSLLTLEVLDQIDAASFNPLS